MTIIHWLLWKLSRSTFNINTAFLLCAFSWWKSTHFLQECYNPCEKKCSLQICQRYSFPCCSQSHHPPQYGLGSSVDFCVPSTYVSQSLSVFVIMCCHGFAWDFTCMGQLLPRHFNSVSSPLVWKGSSFQRSWKVVYRSVGFVYLL